MDSAVIILCFLILLCFVINYFSEVNLDVGHIAVCPW